MYPYISVFGRSIGTYGLCMVLGFALAFYLSYRKGRNKGVMLEDLLIIGAFALGFSMLGSSMLYVFVTYSPAQIIAFILKGDFRFLSSGIVFYGGLVGGILGAFIGIRVAKCKFEATAHAVVPHIPLAHAIGRVGCVMAGCCHGFAYDGPLALYYPHSVSGLSPQQGYFPVQLLETLLNVVIFLFLTWYEKRVKRASDLLFAYLGIYAVFRFFLEMLRGDANRGLWYMLSTSQIISILLLCVSVIGLCVKSKKR